jgi:hypothetical protein
MFFFFDIGSHYIAQDTLKLMIFLPQFLKCWDYRCVPLHSAIWLLSFTFMYVSEKNHHLGFLLLTFKNKITTSHDTLVFIHIVCRRFIHADACGFNLFFFTSMPLYNYTKMYPVYCWWIFGMFSMYLYMSNGVKKILVHIFCIHE